jgi:hypothetical protein
MEEEHTAIHGFLIYTRVAQGTCWEKGDGSLPVDFERFVLHG